MKCAHRQHGFSLVELSIVLVILGLLTGGILAGRSLIRASELRAVGTEYQRFLTATQAFRDKYFAYPGDFRHATRVWGRQRATSDCPSYSGSSVATPGVCDGWGSGVQNGNSALLVSQFRQHWRHLSTAGLIEGMYSGVNGSGGTNHCVPGTDCPASKLSNGGWDIYVYGNNWAGDGASYAGTYGRYHFIFGGASTNGVPLNAIITPEEAWNIDTKLDDGMPGNGKVVAHFWNACGGASSATSLTTNYRLDSSSKACALHFRPGF